MGLLLLGDTLESTLSIPALPRRPARGQGLVLLWAIGGPLYTRWLQVAQREIRAGPFSPCSLSSWLLLSSASLCSVPLSPSWKHHRRPLGGGEGMMGAIIGGTSAWLESPPKTWSHGPLSLPVTGLGRCTARGFSVSPQWVVIKFPPSACSWPLQE